MLSKDATLVKKKFLYNSKILLSIALNLENEFM